ncbi:MAG: extracellular solute-binding protein [Thaumarchaeota archaeon]|nr:extracellular solute-binding protein [Nitrososphaerota archaeon]
MANTALAVGIIALVLSAASLGYTALTVGQEMSQLRSQLASAEKTFETAKKDVSDLKGSLQTALEQARKDVAQREALLQQITPFDTALVAAALKEGAVTIYSIRDQEDMVLLAQEFQKKFPGIKVNFLTARSPELLSKISAELKAGQSTWDIYDDSGSALDVAVEMGATQPYVSKQYTKENFPLLDPRGHVSFYGATVITVIYNTKVVKKSDLEGIKTWADIPGLAAKYPGKVLMDHPSRAGPGTRSAGELKVFWNDDAKWNNYMNSLKALNPRLFKSTGEIARLVISEEGAIGIPGLVHDVLQSKDRGAPLDLIPITPVILNPSAVLISKNAPHPNAAKLLLEYMLSPDGQELYSRAYRTPLRLGFVAKSSLSILFPNIPSEQMIGILNTELILKPTEWVKKNVEPIWGPA